MLDSDIKDPDSTLWVKFYHKSVKNSFRSEKEGHPCFDNRLYISIVSPGDVTSKVDRPASDEDKQRFPKQFANFEAGQSDKIDGTPISEWPQVTTAQVDELRYLGVLSIEQLANASDAQIQRIMAGVSLREKAKIYLKVSKDTAESQRAVSENLFLRSEIEALKSRIAAMGDPKEAATPKRRGRPPKSQAAAA